MISFETKLKGGDMAWRNNMLRDIEDLRRTYPEGADRLLDMLNSGALKKLHDRVRRETQEYVAEMDAYIANIK